MTLDFLNFGLNPSILEAVFALGFQHPTEIQQKTIPFILQQTEDLIALAQTGTGKTAAFALPCLHQIDPEVSDIQVLILSPTRELALQTAKELKKFSKNMDYINSVAIYGGADIGSQSRALSKGCHIVVGTPGRVLDLIQRRRLDLSLVRTIVLDEADEMLKMGFQDDLEAILSETPESKRVLLFSATMPKVIENISKKYMHDAVKITVGERNSTNKNVEHVYSVVREQDRYLALRRWVDALPNLYGIIFCRTKNETLEITGQLRKDGYPVDVINGDLSQDVRSTVMKRFHNQELKVLVATDVAARGIDVDNLSHVLNFNLPDDSEVYVHRSGRTGRAGNQGVAITLVSPGEMYRIRDIERMTKQSFVQKSIPTANEIVEEQLQQVLQDIENAKLSEEFFGEYLRSFTEKLEGYSREEIIAKMLAVLGGSILKQYQYAPDLNENIRLNEKSRDGRSKRGSREKGNREKDRSLFGEDKPSRGKKKDRSDDASAEKSTPSKKETKEKTDRRPAKDSSVTRDSSGAKDKKAKKEKKDVDARVDSAKKTSKKDRFKETTDGKESKKDAKKKKAPGKVVTCEINIGKKDGLNPYRLMGLVNENIKGKKPDFGLIDIQSHSTRFEVDPAAFVVIHSALKGMEFEKKAIKFKKV